jgi:glycosyltransferase involved in cell wall biosynthesis
MRVVHVVPDLAPESGGPAENVPRLCAALREAGVAAELLTVGAVPGSLPPDLPARGLRAAMPARLRRSPELARALTEAPADVLHAHCLWQLPLGYAARAAHRRRLPLVISPRGMLAPWSLRRSALLKLVARLLVHPGAFGRAAGWHATSEQEARDIAAYGLTQPVCVAPNGIEPPADDPVAARAAYLAVAPELRGRRVLLFYSRFHPKKRVLELVRDFAALAATHPQWHLLLAGIPQAYTPERLLQEARAAGLAGRVTALDGRSLPKPYALAELFVLPTHDENFGRAIAEALAHGLPVLTTRGTPWSEVETWGAGRWVTLEGVRPALDQLLALAPDTLRQMGERGRTAVLERYAWPVVVRPLVEFYRELLARQGRA